VNLIGGSAGTELKRDVIVFPKNGELKCVDKLHDVYDPLQYVLLFRYGQFEWNKRQHIVDTQKNVFVDSINDEIHNEGTTPMQYYSYQLQER
jgi:hypothetical protein